MSKVRKDHFSCELKKPGDEEDEQKIKKFLTMKNSSWEQIARECEEEIEKVFQMWGKV